MLILYSLTDLINLLQNLFLNLADQKLKRWLSEQAKARAPKRPVPPPSSSPSLPESFLSVSTSQFSPLLPSAGVNSPFCFLPHRKAVVVIRKQLSTMRVHKSLCRTEAAIQLCDFGWMLLTMVFCNSGPFLPTELNWCNWVRHVEPLHLHTHVQLCSHFFLWDYV